MKLRVRWYSLAPTNTPLRQFADAMEANQYSQRRAAGFRLDEVRRGHILGRFIERLEWDDTLEDPAGGELCVHRLELRQVRFRLTSVSPHLEVLDGPRTLRGLIEQLSAFAGTSVRLVEVGVAPDLWLKELEAVFGKIVVTSITASGLVLSASASATVAIVGADEVRQFLDRFARGQSVRVERMVANLPGPQPARIELLAGGRAGVIEGSEGAIEALRDTLRARLQKEARPRADEQGLAADRAARGS